MLYLVAQGKMKPDLTRCRKDTPNIMLKLIEECIKFNKDERPLFRKVLSTIESLTKTMPKISRSFSEPALNHTHLNSDIFDSMAVCNSPTTPILGFNFKL